MNNLSFILLALSIGIIIAGFISYCENRSYEKWKKEWIEDGIKKGCFTRDNIQDY